MKLTSKGAAILAGVALALPMAAVSTSAQAGTEPPPCTKKAVKKALMKAGADPTSINGKPTCKNYWAAASYTESGMDDAAAMFEDNGGKWKVVGPNKEAKYCKASNKTVPNKVKKAACVS